jgi:hypothetical protein
MFLSMLRPLLQPAYGCIATNLMAARRSFEIVQVYAQMPSLRMPSALIPERGCVRYVLVDSSALVSIKTNCLLYCVFVRKVTKEPLGFVLASLTRHQHTDNCTLSDFLLTFPFCAFCFQRTYPSDVNLNACYEHLLR